MALDKIKGSEFIGTCAPIADEAEAKAFIEGVGAEMPDAGHHAWAWRLTGDAVRHSDAGEPTGTAGKPIMAALLGRGLRNVAVVVTRYSGGVKLGTGGLVKAYGGAAAAVLDAAETTPYVARATMEIGFGYRDEGAVRGVLHAAGLTEDDAQFGASVSFTVTLLEPEAAEVQRRLIEQTSGRATVRVRSSGG